MLFITVTTFGLINYGPMSSAKGAIVLSDSAKERQIVALRKAQLLEQQGGDFYPVREIGWGIVWLYNGPRNFKRSELRIVDNDLNYWHNEKVQWYFRW